MMEIVISFAKCDDRRYYVVPWTKFVIIWSTPEVVRDGIDGEDALW